MKYSHCVDCGKEKLTRSAQQKKLCLSCSKKGACQGKIHSEETRRNMSKAHGGNGRLNPIYPGLKAWSSRNRNKTKFCEWCYSEDNLEAHHIMPKGRFPQYATDDSNCRIMCKKCHSVCHKQGGF